MHYQYLENFDGEPVSSGGIARHLNRLRLSLLQNSFGRAAGAQMVGGHDKIVMCSFHLDSLSPTPHPSAGSILFYTWQRGRQTAESASSSVVDTG